MVTIDANLSQSRREIIWQRVGENSVTLDDISHQFETAVDSLSFTLFSLEHVARTVRGHRTVHRCPGYRREEVTLTPVLSDCKVITHATPSLHEKCVICGQHVEEGLFSCICRQRALVFGSLDDCITDDGHPADDGISPTVKCTKCSVWGHKYCNDQISSICWRCAHSAKPTNLRPNRNLSAPSPSHSWVTSIPSSDFAPDSIQSVADWLKEFDPSFLEDRDINLEDINLKLALGLHC